MFISVDLPEPRLPDDGDELPGLDAKVDVAQRVDPGAAQVVRLADVVELDQRASIAVAAALAPLSLSPGPPLGCTLTVWPSFSSRASVR